MPCTSPSGEVTLSFASSPKRVVPPCRISVSPMPTRTNAFWAPMPLSTASPVLPRCSATLRAAGGGGARGAVDRFVVLPQQVEHAGAVEAERDSLVLLELAAHHQRAVDEGAARHHLGAARLGEPAVRLH